MDEVMKQIKLEDKTPEIVMEAVGVDEVTANFILAIERDEIEGDALIFDA